MTKELIKHFSYGAAFALIVLLILLVAGAMFFSDDTEKIFGERERKSSHAMEIRGNWLGIKLTSLDSPTARRLGLPPSERGVMVIEFDDRNGWRARQAGLRHRDVIVAVNGKEIRDLADVYDVSRKLDFGSQVVLDVLRWGQPLTLVLPAVYVPPPLAGPPQLWKGAQLPPMTAQGKKAGTVPPGTLVSEYGDPQFYCPLHNWMWPQSAVHPYYRCPVCNNPLNRVR